MEEYDHNFTMEGHGNFSSNLTLKWNFYNPFDQVYMKVVFSILYGLVFAACFVGNLLVIIVVLKHRKMRTITNFFLANLAAADLCVGIFCVLQNLFKAFSPVWVLGRVLCKLYYSVQAAAYIASIIILVVISAERYFAILHPLRSKQLTTLFLQRIVVVTIWIVSVLSSIPFLLFYDTVPPSEGSELRYCVRTYAEFNNTAYVLISFVLWYLVPLMVLSFMYARISIVLWRTSQPDKLRASTSNGKANGNSEQSRKNYRPRRLIKFASLTTGRISITGRQNEGSQGKRSSMDYEHCNTVGDIEMQSLGTKCQVVVTCDTDEDDDTLDSSVVDSRDYTDQSCPNYTSPSRHDKVQQFQTVAEKQSSSKGRNNMSHVPVSSIIRSGSGGVKAVRFIEKSPEKAENALVARRRVIRLLIAVVLAFAICVLPSHLYHLYILFGNPDISSSITIHKILPTVVYLILYSNSALNPILYAFLSDNFRKSLKELLKGFKRKSPIKRATMRSTVSLKTANTMI